jgi:cysteine synthase
MARIYNSILETIGNTPLVRAPHFSANVDADILFKLESFNPMSSVKDRIALAMIDEGLKKGRITKETTIIEPTSGNTGIGLALVGAAKQMRVIIVMPDSMSVERRNLIKALGAELELTDGAGGMKAAIARAAMLHEEIPNSILAGQFINPENPAMHRRTTGPEIWRDTDGAVDVLIAGVGTGGTISGTGGYLKEKKPSVKVVAVEPAGSPVLSGGAAGPHKIQGIGAGFIPQIYDIYVTDEIIQVANEDAFETARQLCRKDGIMVGISSGAVAWAARELATRDAYAGQTIVAILASHGERYLSTPLWS